MTRFLAAIRFLTIVPVPGTWGTTEADLAGSVPFFPVVGLALGAAAGAVAWALLIAAPPPLAAVAVTLLLVAVSGGLHMDGLSDTADGFLSSRPREGILEIMKDSRVGPMGVIAIVGVLLAKFAALLSVQAAAFWPAALLMPLAGRCAMVMHMALLAYVRPEGLGTVFCRRRPYFSALWATAVLAAACWALFDFRGLAVAGLCVATALAQALRRPRALVPVPSYIDYARAAGLGGAEVEVLELKEAGGFALDWTALARALRGNETVFLGQPNNPTGLVFDSGEFCRCAAAHPSTLFVVDEAFADFVEGCETLGRGAPPNVVALRSLTKFYAIPGLRLGFAVAAGDAARRLKDHLPPWAGGRSGR